jgi:hypothetical protein
VPAAASVPLKIATATVARSKVRDSRLGERLLDGLFIDASPESSIRRPDDAVCAAPVRRHGEQARGL